LKKQELKKQEKSNPRTEGLILQAEQDNISEGKVYYTPRYKWPYLICTVSPVVEYTIRKAKSLFDKTCSGNIHQWYGTLNEVVILCRPILLITGHGIIYATYVSIDSLLFS
jgi:hypothetical protein